MPRSNNTRIITGGRDRSGAFSPNGAPSASGGRQPGAFVVNSSRRPVVVPSILPENANNDQSVQIMPAASDVTKLALLRVALIAAALLE